MYLLAHCNPMRPLSTTNTLDRHEPEEPDIVVRWQGGECQKIVYCMPTARQMISPRGIDLLRIFWKIYISDDDTS